MRRTPCFHCGTPCKEQTLAKDYHAFCCSGCLTVYELLKENGLAEFYQLDPNAGVRAATEASPSRFSHLDDPQVRERVVSFSSDRITRVHFRIPAIHCVACVWLLENLFRLNPGIGRSEVNFLRKEVTIRFEPHRAKLSEVVSLLSNLGYEPELKYADLNAKTEDSRGLTLPKKLWMKLGVAGFAFGNNMLFSIASYFGLDAFDGGAFQLVLGYLSLVLALPVLLYSAQDYFRLAWTGLKHRILPLKSRLHSGL